MAIEVHAVGTPAWVTALADAIIDTVEPLAPMGPLGVAWWAPGQPANPAAGRHLVCAFPTATEIVRGQHDGSFICPGFHLDVTALLHVFSGVEKLAWEFPAHYNGDLDGPALVVDGSFAGRDVQLRFYSQPPPGEAPGLALDPRTGETWPRPGS